MPTLSTLRVAVRVAVTAPPQLIFVSLIEPPAVSTGTLDESIREAAESWQLGPRTRKMVDMMRAEGHASSVSPKDVARVILEVVTSSNRRLRYPVGSQAGWLPMVKALGPQGCLRKHTEEALSLKGTRSLGDG